MKHMTLKDHKWNCRRILKIQKLIDTLYSDCYHHYGSSHRTTVSARSLNTALDRLRQRLDDEYHKTAPDKALERYGHIYYTFLVAPVPTSWRKPNA